MNPDYFPPYDLLKSGLEFTHDGEVVSMSRDLFALLVRAATATGFDEVWYKSAYPDVSDAVRDGAFRDELEHFSTQGYKEGRLPVYYVVDNDWYLETYPDIGEAIGGEGYADAEAHFNEAGYAEGRAADAAMLAQVEAWDEAIAASRTRIDGEAGGDPLPPTT